MNMAAAASASLNNSPRTGFSRMVNNDAPPTNPLRTKRSNSGSYPDSGVPRSFAEHHASRGANAEEVDMFIPTTLGERLLERTYLEDAVRPLVRALVHTRMNYADPGRADDSSSQLMADLNKLRHELERSAQRGRLAERERDDLARRLDFASTSSEPAFPPQGRMNGGLERMGPPVLSREARSPPTSHQYNADRMDLQPPQQGAATSYASGSSVAVAVAQSDEGPNAYVSISTGRQSPVSRPAGYPRGPGVHSPQANIISTRNSFAEASSDRRPPYPTRPASGGRLSLYEHHHPIEGYPSSNFPEDRYDPRPMFSRYDSGPERGLPPYTSYGISLYPTPHSEEHEDDRPRKQARLRTSFGSADGRTPASVYAMSTPPEPTISAPRKLASTKNRTCSNCAVPHDAKFRRGPKGPGTLCDRCGSRWKKYKESEVAKSPVQRNVDFTPTPPPNGAKREESGTPTKEAESPDQLAD